MDAALDISVASGGGAPLGASVLSTFAREAPASCNLGFSVIPITAGQKYPATSRWQRHCDTRASNDEMEAYRRIPDAGIGIALGYRVGAYQIVAVDLDVDGDDLDNLASALSASPMEKRGAKGLTRYYRADPALKTKRYRTSAGRGLADLQAHGTQTVIPPSRHPAGIDYAWTRGPSQADALPILTALDLVRFEDALEAIGWQRDAVAGTIDEASPAAPQARGEGFGSDRDVNEAAMARLPAWVPALGLYRCAPKPGGYHAVAIWRPSGSSNAPANRKLNLSITSGGIVDFGDGQKGYSPVDLVMAARGCSVGAAFAWLRAQLDLDTLVDASEFADVTAHAERETVSPQSTLVLPADEGAVPKRVMTFDDRVANLVGAEEWLVKNLIPRTGASLVGGQSGVGKSFALLDLASSVATNQSWFGHRMKRPGGTFFLLGEGEATMAKRMRAVAEGRFHNEAPIDPVTGATFDINRFPIGWMPVGQMVNPAVFQSILDDVRIYQERLRAQHGCELVLIVVDTVVSSFGFPDTPDDAQATHAMKALARMSEETGAAVVGVHHFGKSVEAGLTGTYAWQACSEVVLGMTADRAIGCPTKNRNLSVIKNRHSDNEGWNRGWDLKSIEFGHDEDGDPVKCAIAVPIDPDAFAGVTSRNTGVSPSIARSIEALTTALAASAETIVGPNGTVSAVPMRIVREHYGIARPAAPDTVRIACDRSLKAAKEAGLADVINWAGEKWVFLVAANDNSSDQSNDSE